MFYQSGGLVIRQKTWENNTDLDKFDTDTLVKVLNDLEKGKEKKGNKEK